MANPKRRHSNTRTRTRRAHDGLTTQAASRCPHCKAPALSHRVCPSCGHYRGKQFIVVRVKEAKSKE